MTIEIPHYTFSVPVEILDKEYNHLHHAESIKFLEKGRLKYIEERGIPNSYFIKQDLFLVLTKIDLVFLREVKAGEIKVCCFNPRIFNKDIILEQELYNERGKKALTATVYLQFMSGKTKRGVLPGEDFKSRFI